MDSNTVVLDTIYYGHNLKKDSLIGMHIGMAFMTY